MRNLHVQVQLNIGMPMKYYEFMAGAIKIARQRITFYDDCSEIIFSTSLENIIAMDVT